MEAFGQDNSLAWFTTARSPPAMRQKCELN